MRIKKSSQLFIRKELLVIITILFASAPINVRAQDNGEAIGAVAGTLAAIGAGIAAVEQMKERAELTATEWLLTNHPEMPSFSLKTLDFDGKKLKDMSTASVITFKIQEFTPMDNPVLDGQKFVLLGFTSYGWINEYGINFNKVKWFLLDENEWAKMMVSYVRLASGEWANSKVEETLKKGKIVNKGVKIKSKLTIPFYKLSGDLYVVSDYSDEMKFIYNERSLGIFLKKTQDLVQISRGGLIEIHEFFFEENR